MVKDFIKFCMVVMVVTLLSATTAKPKISQNPTPTSNNSDSVAVEFIQTIDSLKYYVDKYEKLKQQNNNHTHNR